MVAAPLRLRGAGAPARSAGPPQRDGLQLLPPLRRVVAGQAVRTPEARRAADVGEAAVGQADELAVGAGPVQVGDRVRAVRGPRPVAAGQVDRLRGRRGGVDGPVRRRGVVPVGAVAPDGHHPARARQERGAAAGALVGPRPGPVGPRPGPEQPRRVEDARVAPVVADVGDLAVRQRLHVGVEAHRRPRVGGRGRDRADLPAGPAGGEDLEVVVVAAAAGLVVPGGDHGAPVGERLLRRVPPAVAHPGLTGPAPRPRVVGVGAGPAAEVGVPAPVPGAVLGVERVAAGDEQLARRQQGLAGAEDRRRCEVVRGPVAVQVDGLLRQVVAGRPARLRVPRVEGRDVLARAVRAGGERAAAPVGDLARGQHRGVDRPGRQVHAGRRPAADPVRGADVGVDPTGGPAGVGRDRRARRRGRRRPGAQAGPPGGVLRRVRGAEPLRLRPSQTRLAGAGRRGAEPRSGRRGGERGPGPPRPGDVARRVVSPGGGRPRAQQADGEDDRRGDPGGAVDTHPSSATSAGSTHHPTTGGPAWW
ncbi:unannotated protein [freshwater metagenome]|uniref:Unannotated protein n=1 Tax=freshwater metagenome TaxID=449393 RepID=A0A6J7HDM0_9ZZZZ